MKKTILTLLLGFAALTTWAQTADALTRFKENPRKAYGNDCPYLFETASDDEGAPWLQALLYQPLCPSWVAIQLEFQVV